MFQMNESVIEGDEVDTGRKRNTLEMLIAEQSPL